MGGRDLLYFINVDFPIVFQLAKCECFDFPIEVAKRETGRDDAKVKIEPTDQDRTVCFEISV